MKLANGYQKLINGKVKWFWNISMVIWWVCLDREKDKAEEFK